MCKKYFHTQETCSDPFYVTKWEPHLVPSLTFFVRRDKKLSMCSLETYPFLLLTGITLCISKNSSCHPHSKGKKNQTNLKKQVRKGLNFQCDLTTFYQDTVLHLWQWTVLGNPKPQPSCCSRIWLVELIFLILIRIWQRLLLTLCLSIAFKVWNGHPARMPMKHSFFLFVTVFHRHSVRTGKFSNCHLIQKYHHSFQKLNILLCNNPYRFLL